MSLKERFKVIFTKKICLHCLVGVHLASECEILRGKLCGINNCPRYHHPLLHRERNPDSSVVNSDPVEGSEPDHARSRSPALPSSMVCQEREPQTTKRPFTIVIEGNAGSGKSTLLNHFSEMMNVDVLPEPVEKWCNMEGNHNLLQLVQANPQRHGMLFQSYAQLTLTQQHTQKPTTDLVNLKVMERSIYSDRYCFIENLHRSRKIEGSEYSVLCEWFKFLTESSLVDLRVDLIVYLRTSPEVAWARVKEHAAHSGTEGQIASLKQLQKLHDLHEEWLMTPHPNVPTQVLVLDADQDVSFSLQLTKSILSEVLKISVDPKICKDVRSELELLDRKILRQQRLRRVDHGRAIFHDRSRHNSLARPRGAHADLQNVSNQVEPKDTPLTLVAQDPLLKTYPKAQMSFGNWNSPTMRLKEEPTSRVLSLRFVDDVFDP